jgi:hypothetical protein
VTGWRAGIDNGTEGNSAQIMLYFPVNCHIVENQTRDEECHLDSDLMTDYVGLSSSSQSSTAALAIKGKRKLKRIPPPLCEHVA